MYNEEWYEGILDDFQSKNLKGLGDFHLRSAIKMCSVEAIQSHGRFREVRCLSKIKENLSGKDIVSGDPTRLLSLIFRRYMESSVDHKMSSDCQERSALKQIVIRRLQAEFDRDYCDSRESFGRDRLIEIYRDYPDCSRHLHLQNALSIILVRMIAYGSDRDAPGDITEDLKGGVSKVEGIFSVKLLGLRLICTSDLFVVEDNNSYVSLFNIDVMRMIVDKITERNLIWLASSVGNKFSSSIYPEWTLLSEILTWGDTVILDFGNTGYKLIKAFEAIILGFIMTQEDDIVVNQSLFLDRTLLDLVEEQPDFQPYIDLLLNCLQRTTSVHHLTQIFGLYRIWGHPVIDSSSGMKKVFTLGTEEKTISDLTARRMGLLFKEQFYVSYYEKYKRYPNYEKTSSEENYIHNMLAGRKRINLHDNRYNILDWNSILTLKTFSVPETFNLSLVLADSAISPTLSELKEVASGESQLMNPKIRRGVLKWLTKDILDCDSLLKEVNNHNIPSDELAIGLYPKEREINSTPRMFALMTLYIRCYIVVTESLLSDDILPLFPQITMTDSMLELTKKIYSGSRKQGSALRFEKIDSYTSAITVCVNMDFEKWNLNMRRESTHYVFEELGLIYGLDNLFNATYDIFENSYIYLSDGDYSVKMRRGSLKLEPPLSYIGHKGGFEGLRQKGWTLFTVITIMSVLNNYKCSYKILGQGDNQVILLTLTTNDITESGFPTPRGVNRLHSQLYEIKSDLIRTFNLLGLPLKPLETWESEKFFIYGKFPVYKGVPCSLSLKKICRIFPFSNDDIMTIDNVLGSIFSNGQAAAMSDINHYISYLVSLIKGAEGILWLLKYHPLSGRSPLYDQESTTCLSLIARWKMSFSDDRLPIWLTTQTEMNIYSIVEMILIIPKSLGGFNGLTEYEFLMRGFPDNATRDYTYLSSIMPHYTGKSKEFIKNWLRLKLLDCQDYSLLLEDPTALNLYLPQSALPLLRREIKTQMRENSSEYNMDFQYMISIDEREDKELFVSYLTTADELYPRLLHDLYESTLYGYVDSIISKIDKTVTIMRLSLSSSSTDLISKLVVGEENFLRYFLWRCHQTNGMELSNCPTMQIRQARNIGWKKNCIGVTVPYPSHTLIWKQCKMTEYLELDCPSSDYISVFYSRQIPEELDKLCSTLGSSPPYLGSITKEKIGLKSKLTIQNTEPLLRRPFNLMRLINWIITSESNTARFIKNTVHAITDLDPNQFSSIPDASSGSADHRYHDTALKHGGLTASLYSLGSYLHMTTDTLETYARGSANVTLHFQALLCWTQHLASLILWNQTCGQMAVPSFSHCHIRCYDCIMPVCESIPDICFNIPEDLIPSCKECKYLYVQANKIFLRDNTSNAIAHILPTLSGLQVSEVLSEVTIRQIISEQLTLMIYHDISDEATRDNHAQATGLMEVGSYPRVLYLKVFVLDIYTTLFHLCLMRELFSSIQLTGDWPTFETLRSKLLLRVKRIKPSNFLGLSMLFSWKSKRGEWATLKGAIMPLSYPLTFSSMCIAAKANFINFISRSTKFPVFKYSNYVLSLTKSDDLIKTMVFTKLYMKDSTKCGYCKYKATRLNFDSEMNISIALSTRCDKGHFVYLQEEFLNLITTVDVSLDKLSKSIPDFIYKPGKPSLKLSIPKVLDYSVQIISSLDKLRYQKNPRVSDLPKWDELSLTNMQSSYLDMIYKTYDNILYSVVDVLLSERSLCSEITEKILILGDHSGTISNFWSKTSSAKVYLLNPSDSSASFPQSFLESVPADISEEMILSGIVNLLPSQYLNFSLKELYQDNSEVLPGIYNCFTSCISTFLQERDCIDNFYSTLINKLAMLNINTIFILCEIRSYEDGWNIINMINMHYQEWRLKVTPYCNMLEKQCWVVGSNIRSRKVTKSLDFNFTIGKLDLLKSLFDSPNKYEYSESYLQSINDLIITDSNFSTMENKLISWLLDGDILPFWHGAKDFTALLDQVSSSFNQKEISSITRQNRISKRLQYKISEMAKRLLIISLSCLTTKKEILLQVQARSPWTIKWKVHPQSGRYGFLLNTIYPVLSKLPGSSDEFYAGMIDYICLMRYIMNHYNFPKYEVLPDDIYFYYITKGEPLGYRAFFFNLFLE